MQYWLVKTEPETYSFEKLMSEGKTIWDGVRNYTARNNLRSMKKGDLVFVYHSVKERSAVGVATVTKESFPDPSIDDERWLAVELSSVRALQTPVSLDVLKTESVFQDSPLLKQSRLSVMPLTQEQFQKIEKLGEK